MQKTSAVFQSFNLSISFVLVFLLIACSPAPTPVVTAPTPTFQPRLTATDTPAPESTPDARVQIRFWHAQPQAIMASLVEKFNASTPDISVVVVPQNTNVELLKNAQAATLAPHASPEGSVKSAGVNGDAQPNVILAYPTDLALFAKSDALVPLDDPKLGFNADDLKDFFPAFVDRYPQFGNRMYSIGLMRHQQVMYYNADLLKNANIKLPETWDDFMKACAALTKPPDVLCFEMNPNAMDFESAVLGRAGGLLTGDAKRVTFDQKPGLDTLMFLNDLFIKKYAVLTTRAFQAPFDFAAGKVAFTFDTTLALPLYDKQIKNGGKNFAWGIAAPPRTATPIVMAYGPSLAILNSSPEKQQAAFTFVKWMLAKEANSEWAIATSSFPARQSAKDNLSEYVKTNQLYGTAFNWLRFARAEPNLAAWASVRTIIADGMLMVASGKVQPADALKDVATKSNSVLGQ